MAQSPKNNTTASKADDGPTMKELVERQKKLKGSDFDYAQATCDALNSLTPEEYAGADVKPKK